MRLPLLVALSALLLLGLARPAQAACVFTVTAGDDNHVCDSGSAPALTDTAGNNSLTLPAGGSGVIVGDVNFGDGDDSVTVDAGEIGGTLDQNAGTDTYSMSGGIIRGDLNQGDGLDRFRMTGGWIVGNFDSGDFAEMFDGRIGNVNMRLDQNTFIMRGGVIDRNLVTAFDRDYVEIFAGSIGGNISVSGGDDQVLVHGGQVGGNILLSTGNDLFSWDGGTIGGAVQLGAGNDQATLNNLAASQLQIVINGDTGQDSLTFGNSKPAGGALYTGWESIGLNNGTVFTLNDTLTLGDSSSATGSINIDASSSLVSTSGVISPFTSGQHASVNNAGLIDLSSGGNAQGVLTINGNYTGTDGTLQVNSVLAGDGAASDKLVVNQGAISGTTNLVVNNLGGAGAATTRNGIQVVEAAQGATSTAGAFVQTQVLRAGAFDYRLVKGGVTPDSTQSWYLVSNISAAPEDAPVPVPAPVPAPALNQPELPTPAPGQTIPLYSPETVVYSAAPRAAALIGRFNLGTFHQRQGDQTLLNEQGAFAAGWGQAYGYNFHQSWSGTVDPSLDGSLYGFKVGQDLYSWLNEAGYRQHTGLYVSHSRLDGDVKGFAQGIEDHAVGDLDLTGDSVGVYWTLISPLQWYVDTVLQFTDLDGRARSDRGSKLDLDGHAWTASVEFGWPFVLSSTWTLEPQAQLIAQQVSLKDQHDQVTEVEVDAQTELSGRVGVRLEGNFKPSAVPLQFFVQSDIWHNDGGRDTLTFAGVDKVKTDYRSTALTIGTGLVARLSDSISVLASIDYTANLDARQQERVGANLGMRLSY